MVKYSLFQANPLSQKTYEEALETHREAVAARALVIRNEIVQLYGDDSRSDAIARLQTTLIILESGLFDAEFYLGKYEDIRKAGVDPLSHYVSSGESEGRQPNPAFFPDDYRQRNMPDVPAHCFALEHYIREGEQKRLKVSSIFAPDAYLEANPPLANFVDRPFFHFLKIGRLAKLNIRPIGKRPRRSPSHSSPRIAAYLGVKDEVELIDESIAHLRAIGVDYIMVCDMSSTDGTAEKLEKHRSDDLSILTLTNDAIGHRTKEEDGWYDHAFRRYSNAPADWVLFLDADEFWLPASGNLKDCEALQVADALLVERRNVVLGPDGPLIPKELNPSSYDQVLLFAKTIPNMHMEIQRHPELPWILGADDPKVMAKRIKIEGTVPGQHDVINWDDHFLRVRPNDLIIAHLALSTRKRFEQKVRNICAIYEDQGIDLSLPEEAWQNFGTAWHWRRWAAAAQAGRIDDEFLHNVTSFERIDRLRSEGVTRTAYEILAQGTISGW